MTTRDKNRYKLVAKLRGSVDRKEIEDNNCKKCRWHLNNMAGCVKLLHPEGTFIDMTEFMFQIRIKNTNETPQICILFEKK